MAMTHRKPAAALTAFVRIARSNDGFTLVELIVAFAIIGVLSFMAIHGIDDFIKRTKISRAAAEIRGLEKDIISWASEKGSYPTPGSPEANQIMTLRDPWGNLYVYKAPATRWSGGIQLNYDFDLYSNGPDGASSDFLLTDPTSEDDIVRAGDGSYDGPADRYGI